MNKVLNKLERKFGRYAIHDLMRYIVGLYIAGFIINMIDPYLYYLHLAFDIDQILKGQVWRIFTCLIQPIEGNNIFLTFISVYFYYMIGSSLERSWGAFRFNLFFISGIFFNFIASIVIYLAYGYSIPIPLTYVNQSLFFAFAVMFPDVEFLVMFILPVKAKILGIIYAALELYNIVQAYRMRQYYYIIAILFAFANFIIFYLLTKNYKKHSPKQMWRRNNYKRQVRQSMYGNVTQFKGKNVVTRHKCAICGRTELDDDNLEFRFCSKCEGNYEYCMDHLYTHEHVKR